MNGRAPAKRLLVRRCRGAALPGWECAGRNRSRADSQGEVVIADGAAISVMRSDAQVGLVVEQAIDDIGGFAGRRDRNRMVGRLASRERWYGAGGETSYQGVKR